MSNGITESITVENDDDGVEAAVAALPAEELQESHEEILAVEGVTEENAVVKCIQIDISERSSFQDDGEYSGQSSAAATPLERSEEVSEKSEDNPQQDSRLIVKEWNSFINLLARIPVKAQKGLSTFDLKLTCIATINEDILVLGTNVGVVYWYNRKTDVLDRLRCDGLHPVTSLSCICTVDYMVAAGSQAGLVTIFQIPRMSPPVVASGRSNATPAEVYYERKTKKSQRFLVQDLHKGAVTALEWSRNGMKLFSGDQTGQVVLTDIDYDLVQIRSSVLLCENYEIVQLSYARKSLLICSTFRSVIFSLENKSFSQVGLQGRKVTGKFGGLIVSSAWEESPKVYSVRPGGRLWVANLAGSVQHTIKFKELILSGSQSEIHVIKPRQQQPSSPPSTDIQFSRLFRFMKDYLVTYHKDILHIVDARSTLVLGTCKELRGILDVAVNKEEVFILESPRNVIRLSAKPDSFSGLTASNFFSNFTTNQNNNSSNLGGSSTNSDSDFSPLGDGTGVKQTIPDIMSASIADFRFPHEPINFITSKLKETSEKMMPKINPLLNTIKTVIEADVDIEDGQKLFENGIPSPVMVPSESGVDMVDFNLFSYPVPVLPPEESIFVPEPERFQKITQLPFEDVVVAIKATGKTAKKGGAKKKGKVGRLAIENSKRAPPSEDSLSVSSAFSNTSGSENNGLEGVYGGASSASSAASNRKLSLDATTTSSAGSNSGSEPGIMSASEHPYMYHHLKDQLGVPLALSQSWSVGTLLPNKSVTTEELHLKEELLARQLKWPELLPASVSADGLFDEPAVVIAGGKRNLPPGENYCWQVDLPRHGKNVNKQTDENASSVLTLVGSRGSGDGHSEDDTDSRTLSLEHGASFATVIEREVVLHGDNGTDAGGQTEDGEDDDEDTIDFYSRYRSKDSYSVSSLNSVLSYGPPSGSSYISNGGVAFGAIQTNHSSSNDNNAPEQGSSGSRGLVEEELCSSKEKSSDTATSSSTVATTSTSTEEADSIVESKIVTSECWRKWRLPDTAGGITQLTLCEKYIVVISGKGTVYYSSFDSITLRWKTTNYSASAMALSPCGTVVWRVYRSDLYSLTNPAIADSAASGPIGDRGEQWSRLTQKNDVVSAAVQRSFGWVVRGNGSLEFCTGLSEARLIPYFEKVYTPWPIQEVTCCGGHRLWALTTDGRLVFRVGTTHLNPKGKEWLEVRWSNVSNVPTSIVGISGGDNLREGVTSVWFTDANQNLYFTSDERDSKGAWVPWKVAVTDGSISSSQETSNIAQFSKSVLLTSFREVGKSLKSFVQPGQRSSSGLKLCCSKMSVWFTAQDYTLLYGNRSTVTGHRWKPIRVDQGITIPNTWTHIYANSVYNGHGNLWVSDTRGSLFSVPPQGGKIQQLDLPMFTDGQILVVAPAPEALWVLTSSGDVHGRCDITTTNSLGKSWRQIRVSMLKSTQFVHISCGSEVAWAVDDKGEVYMRTGSLRPPGHQDMSPAWNKVETSVCCKGVFTKVYVGANDSMVWALDNEKRIYVRQAVFPDYPIGTGWLLVKGVDADMLSISDTAVWALSTNGSIYRRHGITKTNFVGDYWRKIPGTASAIAVSLCDELWALTSEGYLLRHSKKIMELKGWGEGLSVENNAKRSSASRSNASSKIVLDEEDEDWELVDNSEI